MPCKKGKVKNKRYRQLSGKIQKVHWEEICEGIKGKKTNQKCVTCSKRMGDKKSIEEVSVSII